MGQGLANSDKLTTKVQTWLQDKLGVNVNLELLAHSVAIIAIDKAGNAAEATSDAVLVIK